MDCTKLKSEVVGRGGGEGGRLSHQVANYVILITTFNCDQYANHVVMDAFLNTNNFKTEI